MSVGEPPKSRAYLYLLDVSKAHKYSYSAGATCVFKPAESKMFDAVCASHGPLLGLPIDPIWTQNEFGKKSLFPNSIMKHSRI